MELDQFKNELRSSLATGESHRTNAEIVKLLDKNPAQLIKKSLYYEIIFGFLFIVGFVFLASFEKLHFLRIYFAAFCLLIIVLWIILVRLLMGTTNLLQTESIKSNLAAYIRRLELFIKTYQRLSMLLVPVCMMTAGIMGWIEKANHGKKLTQWKDLDWNIHIHTDTAVLFTGSILLVSAAQFYFTKWYLKQLYGQYLGELKQYLQDLETN